MRPWVFSTKHAVLFSVSLTACSVLAAPVNAQTNWTGATGSWFDSGNWSAGVPPGATPLTTVGNGGTAQIAGAAANAGTSLGVSGGSTVDLQSGGSLTAGTIGIGPNGTLLLSGATAVTGDLSMQGGTLRSTVTGTLTDSLVFGAGTTSTIAAAAGQTLTLGGPSFSMGAGNNLAIFGSATDTGTIVLAPTSGMSGNIASSALEVAGGTLRIGSFLSASAGAGVVSVTVDGGATLDYDGFSGTIRSLLGAGSVQIAGGTLTLQSGTSNFAGTIAGSGGALSLIGANVTLSGANTYSGGTTIDAASTLTLGNGGSIVGSIANAGVLNINSGSTLSLSGSLSGTASSRTSLNGGTLRATTTSTVTDSLVFGAGTTSTIAAAAGQTLTLGGRNFFMGAGNNLTIFGSATDTGTVVLAPTSGMSGDIVTSALEVAGGTLRIGSFLSAGAGQGVASVTVDGGATLDYDGFSGTIRSLLGAGSVQIAGGTLTLQSATSNFAGTIAGSGGALSLISANVTLTGANTYNGGTTIDAASTLTLGNGRAGGSIVGGVVNDGTFIIDRSDSFTFGGAISGTGAFVQAGSGTTVLTGVSTYTGSTSVNAGTLEVDGSIANSSNVTVVSGGTLSGTGIVDPTTTTIMGGGRLAPGNAANPAGTLTITGNLAFQSGALYLVHVGATAASLANVSGTATLSGASVQPLISGMSARSYDILHAADGFGGTAFNTLADTNPNFNMSLSYTATDVFLNLTAVLGAGANLNQNQQNVANVVNNAFNSNGGLPAGFANVFGLTGGSLANALSALDGEVATGAERAASRLTTEFLELMLDPFASGRGNAGLGGAAIGFMPEQQASVSPDIALAYASILNKAPPKTISEQRWTAWATAFGGADTANGNTTVGSNNITASTFGFAGGMDYHFSPNTIAGFALAGAGTNWGLANALGTGRSEAFQVGAYGVNWFGPAYIAGALSFSNHWFTTDRSALGDQLSANFVGQSYGARVEGGYRTAVLPGFGVTPYAALQVQALHTPAYNETDVTSGAFGLTYAATNTTDVRSELGVRFDDRTLISGKPLILFGRLAWAHDFAGDPAISAVFQSLPGAGFTVNGAPIALNSALTTAGAQLFLTPNWTLLAKFEGEFASDSRTYAGTGTLRYTW
jgi:autotransporter-associated beta strand protein